MGMYDQPFSVTEPRCTCQAADYELRLLCPEHVMRVARCKHCKLKISSRSHDRIDWIHVQGDQMGKHTCALEPYGFHAEPEGAPCSDFSANPCNGSRGIEPRCA